MMHHEIEFESLSGRRIAIDAYNTIYQFLSIIRGADGNPLMDSKGHITSHLSGLLYRTVRMVEMGIEPVFVFDGKPPPFKGATLEQRSALKADAQKRLEEARERGETELKKYAQATVRLNDEIIDESKLLLTNMGIPVVQAPSEGEAEASYLAMEGRAYAVGSQDFDSLLFGAPKLVRNLTLSGRRKLPSKGIYVEVRPEMIDLNESLKAVGLTRQKLIWVALMVGTDYNDGIKGIGPKKGLAAAQKASSLKEIFEIVGHAGEYDALMREIEEFYLHPPVHDADIKFGEPKREKIVELLCGVHDFSVERVESALDKIMKQPEQKSQSKLDDWL